MSRPLRLEYAGSLYHAKSRGDRQENIFENDIDRKELLLVFVRYVVDIIWFFMLKKAKGKT